MNDIQATKALKREHPALEIHYLFSMFVGHFIPPGSGSGLRIQIRMRIQGPH
jgi:hypothetical protein